MRWMVHAVTWADGARPDDAPEHQRVVDGPLCALVTDAAAIAGDGQAIAIDPDHVDQDLAALLLRYDRLIDAYALEQDVLPMRFGQLLERPKDARRMLRQNAKYLAQGLAALAGRREITVKVTRSACDSGKENCPPLTSPEPTSSGGYLAERLAARKSREAAQQVTAHFVHRVLVSLESVGVPMALPSLGPSGARLAGWTCLIRSEAAASATAAVQELDLEASRLGLSVGVAGPHAPFSFAAEVMRKGESAA